MKAAAAATTGLAGLVTAVAGAGWYAVAGLGVLVLALIAVACWVIANSVRTFNAVALISAARGKEVASGAGDRPDPQAASTPDDPAAPSRGGAMSYPTRSVTPGHLTEGAPRR